MSTKIRKKQLSQEITDEMKANQNVIESISVNGKVINPDPSKNVEVPIPTSLPASDVYDWAKQPQKPSYTASEVGADPSGSADDVKKYTDQKFEELIGTSPENLDTIYELAQAILDNQDVVQSINDAVTNKVDKVPGKGLSEVDVTNQMVQNWNNKSDFSGSYNDLTDKPDIGTGGQIELDTAMSDTSENAVQNKVIKRYVDGTVEQIDKYQKYVNLGLEYAALQQNGSIPLTQGLKIPFNLVESKEIEISENGNPILKAGKTYHVTFSMRIRDESTSNNGGRVMFVLRNITDNEGLIGSTSSTKLQKYTSTIGNGVITPNSDIEVGIFVSYLEGDLYVDNGFTRYLNNLIIQEIGREVLVDPVEYLDQEEGLQDTPVGHILTHMGTKAPKHYLTCDGSTYNVGQYPYLEQHFKEEFGSVNFFGGDGVSTFAVPDLRGEFLRGSGTNSHSNQGKGGNVGTHQDGTNLKYNKTLKNSGYNQITISDGKDSIPENCDWSGGGWNLNIAEFVPTRTYAEAEFSTYSYTSRPTNTSVLYCIKYEPTYAIKNTEVNYSYEERRIGTWVDGKPLYEKTVKFGSLPNASTKEVLHGIENVDVIWVCDGFTSLNNVQNMIQYPHVEDAQFNWNIKVGRKSIIMDDKIDRSNSTATVTLRYTKTTDQPTS